MAKLDSWIRDAVDAQWPWEGLPEFLGVSEGFDHAELPDALASGVIESPQEEEA